MDVLAVVLLILCFGLYGPLEYHLMLGHGWQPWFALWLAVLLCALWICREDFRRLGLCLLGAVFVLFGTMLVGYDGVCFIPIAVGVCLSAYHIWVFGLGFGLLSIALLGLRFKALGAWLVGVVLQDALWFLSAGGMVCGQRYGVYFHQWLYLGGLCVPLMYVVACCAGVSLFVLEWMILRRRV